MNDNITLPSEFVPPDYNGGSIANIPATAAALLDAPFSGLPPLRPELWQPLGQVKRVILLIIDAFGHNLWRQEQAALAPLLPAGYIADSITSVFPSTTVNALSSIWTGAGPAGHGLVGLKLFFPEYAVLGQMIGLAPAFTSMHEGLVRAGLQPEQFLQAPAAPDQLAAAGVPTYALKYYTFINSGLGRMHDRGLCDSLGTINSTDLMVQMRRLLEDHAGERLYTVAYWHTVDTISHRYGWDSDEAAADLRAIFRQLKAEFIDPLTPAARAETALLITGDHGQTLTPDAQKIRLPDEPALQKMLLMQPAGEARVPYLYARQGAAADLKAYLAERWPEAMTVLTADQALAAGLYGPPPFRDEVRQRLGDLVLITHDGWTLQTEADESWNFVGRHGGMTPPEMEAAWLAMRLD